MNLSEYTVNGDAATLYLISFEHPKEERKVLFTNLDEVRAGNVNLEELPRPILHKHRRKERCSGSNLRCCIRRQSFGNRTFDLYV